MLLATSDDKTASIWNVPSGTTWSSIPYATFEGHKRDVRGGAFLGDESHVITGSYDGFIRIWRTSDRAQTANYKCGGAVRHALSRFLLTFVVMQVWSLSYHAASGNIILGLFSYGYVEIWQTDPYIAPSTAPQVTLPDHVCVRERLAEAQAEANDIQVSLEKANIALRQQISREQELKRSIAELEAKRAHIFFAYHT